ncbi:hypothetical protein DPX16_11205 [Anabarilius grahami]|uniref:Uncharacterized protein n=1 Tax=Anabarilius grahami TaxID=495550 RepID=A0A3N0Y2Q8_ANAGA|nr:hypothetical protein DPX16_11205 [Anabarilius grahami]
MGVRFHPRSNRGDVIGVREIAGPPVGGMDLAFKKLLQDENWSCSQHMVLNDAKHAETLSRAKTRNGTETLFMLENMRTV